MNALTTLALFAQQCERRLQATDWIVPAVAAWYVLLMVTAPIPGHGDSTEWTQRPFVLLYAVVAV